MMRTLWQVLALGIFSMACAQTPPGLTTLHPFAGKPGDGSFPMGGVVIGSDGTLYGTTDDGGAYDSGTIFSLTPPASAGGPWTEAVLYSFTGGIDGGYPHGGVVIGGDGTLCGTTAFGGRGDAGTVFSLSPPSAPGGAWTQTVLHSFMGGGADGVAPNAGVVIGTGGVLYGTTYDNLGAVFSLTPPAYPGYDWTEKILHTFTGGSDGQNPNASLAVGAGGVVYGTTAVGGSSANAGIVFSLTPPASGNGPWTEKFLHVFSGPDGDSPNAVVIGGGGRLYGTTYGGGSGGGGVVFSLAPTGLPDDPWRFTVLHNFADVSGEGDMPLAAVTIGSGGALFGTTTMGGKRHGTAFVLRPPTAPGGSWTESVLYRFTGLADGGDPWGAFAIGPQGLLYGTTTQGALVGGGTVFSLQP